MIGGANAIFLRILKPHTIGYLLKKRTQYHEYLAIGGPGAAFCLFLFWGRYSFLFRPPLFFRPTPYFFRPFPFFLDPNPFFFPPPSVYFGPFPLMASVQ